MSLIPKTFDRDRIFSRDWRADPREKDNKSLPQRIKPAGPGERASLKYILPSHQVFTNSWREQHFDENQLRGPEPGFESSKRNSPGADP